MSIKETIVETWTMHTAKGTFDFAYPMDAVPTPFKKPAVWMKDFKKTWDNPQDPIHFEFTLSDEKYIQDALNYLYNGPQEDVAYPVEEQS
jgi:hypothetical protein